MVRMVRSLADRTFQPRLVAQELSLRNTEGSLQREVTRLRGQVIAKETSEVAEARAAEERGNALRAAQAEARLHEDAALRATADLRTARTVAR